MRQVLAALVTALVVVASAFGVAGCGGGYDEGFGAMTATETTAEETTETTPAAGGGEAGLLEGTVGPDFTIDLQQNYEPLTTLSPGSYQLVVEDYSAAHNFHLTGPGWTSRPMSPRRGPRRSRSSWRPGRTPSCATRTRPR